MLDFTQEELELLKRTIAKGTDELEFALFVRVCQQTGLNPFARQICPVMRWDAKASRNVMAIQTQVDGFRLIAQRTKVYAGSDRPLFDEGLTIYEHQRTGRDKPSTCTVTVWKIVGGQRCSFTHEISWDEFYPGEKLGFMWRSKKYQMMAKTAESQALRKAFQSEIGPLRTEEEINAEMREATPRQERTGYDWAEFCEEIQAAKSMEQIDEIEDRGLVRFPSNRYAVEREADNARDLLAMGGRVLQPSTTPEFTTPPNPEEREMLMGRTDADMVRLGWTKEYGSEYLQKTYKVKSRQKLGIEQLRGFAAYLKELPTPEPASIKPGSAEELAEFEMALKNTK